jgi:hypothetical protein
VTATVMMIASSFGIRACSRCNGQTIATMKRGNAIQRRARAFD